MRRSLESIMSDEGYLVECGETAEEGVHLLEPKPCFMVITDANLGGMSGYELLGKVLRRWPNIPVVVITAYATPRLAAEAIKAGATDYLAKPFAPEGVTPTLWPVVPSAIAC